MSSLWQKAMYFLGLDDESRELDEREVAAVSEAPATYETVPRGRRVEPPPTSRWRPANTEAHIESVSQQSVRQVPAGGEVESAEIVVAATFADAQLVADYLRGRHPVVLDLRETEPDTVRRLVDFTSGLTYALDGTMQKVAQGVILISPARVTLSGGELQRLSELGLYQLEL